MRARFEKWEGLGNDFVLLRDPGELARALDDAAVRRLCDRRLGVGADGVLLVEATGSGPPRMIVRNADGSRPEMCGNGLRCVAGHLFDGEGPRAGTVVVVTDAGERRCDVRVLGDGRADVSVEMGVARAGADLVASFGGRAWRFRTIDMGNPHAVSFDDLDEGVPTGAFVDALGPVVEALPAGGTNVELCRAREGGIDVVVWERGVGRTLACGTGACAVAAVACDTDRARFGEPVAVSLPGGALEVVVAPGTRAVRMRGPARRVFSGEVVIA